jgi:transposase
MEWRQIFRIGYQSLLYSFLDKYHTSEIKQIAGFVGGLIKDLEAVENAVSSRLSNGFVEETNNKLKMIKCTMYEYSTRKIPPIHGWIPVVHESVPLAKTA